MYPPTVSLTQAPEHDLSAPLLTSPVCVMVFNTKDPSGDGDLATDIGAIASVGAHAFPVVTGAYARNTKDILDHFAPDEDAATVQARAALEDMTLQVIKVGFVGSPDNLGAVAGIAYDFIDNVLATPEAMLASEKFERFDVVFSGAGNTLTTGCELAQAFHEAPSDLDRCLAGGFHPGVGQSVPDRLFWVQPEESAASDAALADCADSTPLFPFAPSLLEPTPNDTKH